MNRFNIILFTASFLLQIKINPQWALVPGLPQGEFSTIYKNDDMVYASAGNKLYLSADLGETWTSSGIIKEEVDFVSSILKVDNRILAGTYVHGIFQSTDNGISWIPFNNGLTGVLDIQDIVQRGGSIYAGTIGSSIYTSSINGSSWSAFNNNIPMNIAGTVHSLYNFKGRLITGSGLNAHIYYNDFGTSNWNEIKFADFSPSGTAMIAIINKDSILYGIGSQGIYKSINGGLNWEKFNPALNLIESGVLRLHNGIVFAMLSTFNGTYYFTCDNDNNQWDLFEYQPGILTYDFILSNNNIFASRLDGLYSRDITATSVNDDGIQPGKLVLYQNYPNPFNPSTKIHYMIGSNIPDSKASFNGQTSKVVLNVFDLLGNEIAVLVDEEQQDGSYEVEFNSANLTSGVYFYRLQAGAFIQTKKMVLLR